MKTNQCLFWHNFEIVCWVIIATARKKIRMRYKKKLKLKYNVYIFEINNIKRNYFDLAVLHEYYWQWNFVN